MDLDLFIFSAFLALSLVLGFMSSTKVTNISEYALGSRDFPTSTLVATIVATWIGAGLFSYTLIETYRQGIYFLVPLSMDSLVLVLIGYVFAPRMGEFLGKLSIAESMGEMFGSKVRIITVIFSLLRTVCFLGINFQVSSTILESVFGTSGEYATLLSGLIVIAYSTLGGIKAVTFTDVIQFFTFGCLMPAIAIIAWQALGDSNSIKVWNTLTTNPIFDYKKAFDLSNPKFYEMLGVCLVFLIPTLEPESFQRVSMARSVNQVMRSFKIAGILCLLFQVVVAILGIFILSDNPNLDPDSLVSYIISHYTYPGFKGMVAVGIMAMIMSSADSAINSISIIFAHDFCKPLGLSWANNELIVARVASLVSGFGAMLVALKVGSIFDLMLSFAGLYLPVVSIPFILAVFGFRSSGKSVFAAMCSTIFVLLVCKFFLSISSIPRLIIGIITSITVLFGTHYLTKQDGGWIGIKDNKTFRAVSSTRRRFWDRVWQGIVGFNFIKFCKSNMPQKIETYFFFGMVAIVSTIVSMISMPSSALVYNDILSIGYMTVLTLACYQLTYPLWPNTFKHPAFVSIFWILSSLYIYIFVSSIFLVLGDGSSIQTAIFFLNITAILLVFRWRVALIMFLVGFGASIWFMTSFIHVDYPHLTNMKFYLVFCLLLLSSILIAFLRPSQERYDKNTLLLSAQSKEMRNMSQQLLNHMIIRQEFINNVNHEIRTPIHHVGAYLEELGHNLNSPDTKEKQESFEMLKQGYQRIRGYMDDILDLSNLSNNKVELKYTKVNFQKLVSEMLDQFTNLYIQDKDLHFYLDCRATDVSVDCDKDKITQVLINLLKNASEFTPKGTIEVVLSNKNILINRQQLKGIECSIIDEGVGIPEQELLEIFGPFIQSSRTKNMSGGKGLGLAICEHIIKLHNGRIHAKNNDKKGATVSFIIPLKKS